MRKLWLAAVQMCQLITISEAIIKADQLIDFSQWTTYQILLNGYEQNGHTSREQKWQFFFPVGYSKVKKSF